MRQTGRAIRVGFEEFIIKPMIEHDLLEVVEIEESCELSRWGWDAYHKELSADRGTLMFVARRTGDSRPTPGCKEIGGFIASRLIGRQLHINNVAVRPVYRRRGLGHALMERALAEAERCGAREALLEVRIGNVEAQALYQKNGFSPVARRKNYYTAPPEDALVMSRYAFASMRRLP